MNTLSFGILDDLDFEKGYGPIHIEFEKLDKETLYKCLEKLTKPFQNYLNRIKGMDFDHPERWKIFENEESDPSGYYFSDYFNTEEVVNDLLYLNYHFRCHFEKYYVVAFSINFARYKIGSKDCDSKLIKWRENDELDPIYEEFEE